MQSQPCASHAQYPCHPEGSQPSLRHIAIKKGVWIPTEFNAYAPPRTAKSQNPSARSPESHAKSLWRLNTVTVPPAGVALSSDTMAHIEGLMRRLGGDWAYYTSRGYIWRKPATMQVKLATEDQKKFALSTHRWVLLQTRLSYGISSTPGYVQENMDQLTSDLWRVAVYMDDILVSCATADGQLKTLTSLLCTTPIQDKGVRCDLNSVYLISHVWDAWATRCHEMALSRSARRTLPTDTSQESSHVTATEAQQTGDEDDSSLPSRVPCYTLYTAGPSATSSHTACRHLSPKFGLPRSVKLAAGSRFKVQSST